MAYLQAYFQNVDSCKIPEKVKLPFSYITLNLDNRNDWKLDTAHLNKAPLIIHISRHQPWWTYSVWCYLQLHRCYLRVLWVSLFLLEIAFAWQQGLPCCIPMTWIINNVTNKQANLTTKLRKQSKALCQLMAYADRWSKKHRILMDKCSTCSQSWTISKCLN